jgi:hypothetical protein
MKRAKITYDPKTEKLEVKLSGFKNGNCATLEHKLKTKVQAEKTESIPVQDGACASEDRKILAYE